jgi:hypothetical protein
VLTALPIRTFGDVAVLGFEVAVHFPRCYRVTRIDPVDDRLQHRVFAGARFRCTGVRHFGSAHPDASCDGFGHLRIDPPADQRILADQAIPWWSISCRRCVPHWQIGQAARDRPPWDAVLGRRDVQHGCPARRSTLTTTWHGGPGIPFTDGYRRQA